MLHKPAITDKEDRGKYYSNSINNGNTFNHSDDRPNVPQGIH